MAKNRPMLNATEGLSAVTSNLNLEIGRLFKILLEEKHIYQKVTVDAERIIATVRENIIVGQSEFDYACRRLSSQVALATLEGVGKLPDGVFYLTPVNVKLFCESCDRREAFTAVWFKDITNDLRSSTSLEIAFSVRNSQYFAFLYHCQSCKTEPQAFLVSRRAWQFSLEGRSPIEHIEVPAYIPKPERPWFRDAVIALHGGKVLAALFYMRVFIEQFARRQTGISGKKTGVEIMSAYAETIPQEHRSFMPSLREWYDKLSEPIHEAKEDAALFEEARRQIERHFDFRRVFGIAEGSASDSPDEKKSGQAAK